MKLEVGKRRIDWRLLACLCIGMSSAQAAVDLDPTFPNGGTAQVSLGNAEESSHGIALGPNGKIVLSGRVDISPIVGSPNYRLGLLKLNSDGTPDMTFNLLGTLVFMNACDPDVLATGGSGNNSGHNVAVQSDGKIVLVGSCMKTYMGVLYEYSMVARFNTDGTLDNTFDGDGIFTLPAGPTNISNRADAVAIQADGRIVFGGVQNPIFARLGFVERLMPNGTVDTSFGTNGQYQSDAFGPFFSAIRIMSDGRIVIGGSVLVPGMNDVNFLVERLTSAGVLDTTFNGTGRLSVNVGPLPAQAGPYQESVDRCFDIALRPDGSILCAGMTQPSDNSHPQNAVVAQFTPGGALDTNWGEGGLESLTQQGVNSYALAVGVRPGGDIFVTGGNMQPAHVQLDGLGYTTFSLPVEGWSMAVQPDQNIVVAVADGTSPNFIAKRFTATIPPPPDTTPDAFSFPSVGITSLNVPVVSTPATITGITSAAQVTVSAGGEYSIGCNGSWTGSGTTRVIANGGTLCLRHTASTTSNVVTVTTVTVGGVQGTFASTTGDADPNAFSFVDQTGVAKSTVIISADLAINGINIPTSISITGGEYSIGCGATFTGADGSISNAQTVCVRHTSSASGSTAVTTTLTVGGVSDSFTSTTAADPPADSTPDAFTFIDQTGVAKSTMITSAGLTISGISTATPISVTGGEYSIGCGATFTTAAGTISNAQTVCVRHLSSASASTVTTTTLTVGGVSDSFTSTTAADPPPPPVGGVMNPNPTPPSGGGGGSIDPWYLAFLALLVGVAGMRQARRQRQS